MTGEDAVIAYARAWVALNAKGNPDLSAERALDAFYLLPSPQVSLAEWAKARGLVDEPEDRQRESAPGIIAGNGYAIVTDEATKEQIEAKISMMQKHAEQAAMER